MKGMLDLPARGRRKPPPAKANGVQPDEPSSIARYHREGWRVERKLGPTRSHHRFSNPRVLVEPGIRTQYCEIIDSCVACQATEARDDRMVSDLAIVTDMRAIHEVVVVTNPSAASPERGTHMDRDLFSDLRPLTDFETGRFAVECPVLRLGAEARVRKDSTIRTDMRPTQERDMRTHFDAWPELHLATDECERADDDVIGQNRSVFDACGRMDVGQGLSPFR